MPAPAPNSGKMPDLRDILVGTLALAVAGLAIAIWRERAEIHRLTQADARDADRPAAPVTLRSATTRILQVAPSRADAQLQEERRWTEQTGERGFTGGASRTDGPPPGASALARLLDNPEFVRALELHRQATLDTRFAGLFRRLDLGAGELAAFKHLLAEKENVALDVIAVNDSLPGGALPTAALNAGVTAARSQVEEAIRSSLGNERYALYHEYEQTLPQRAIVAQLEQRLSYSGAPLTVAQADSLMQVLVAHAPPLTPDSVPAAMVVSTGTPTAVPLIQMNAPAARVTEAVLTESQTVLAPPQLAALRDIQAEQVASLRAFQLIRDNLPPDDAAAIAMRQLLQ